MNYPNAKIVGFEPNPNIFPLLEENIYCNNIHEVDLHNIALGNTEGIREFHIDNQLDAFSTSGFKPNAWNGKQSTAPIFVKTEKLSKYINTQIDLMKMDIEGAEKEVLKELEQTDKLKYIRNIVIECHKIDIKEILKRNSFELSERKDSEDKDLVYILGKNTSQEPI
jgi:FkbM family methyltransferase